MLCLFDWCSVHLLPNRFIRSMIYAAIHIWSGHQSRIGGMCMPHKHATLCSQILHHHPDIVHLHSSCKVLHQLTYMCVRISHWLELCLLSL